jgi:formylglycine-generating enzyme required for sulfatase activity/DNA-binding winged helix-turn-helix (wHTH) protein
MSRIPHRVLCFDRFALDLTRGSLRDDDRDIDLPPKAFEVLRYLVENAGRLVSKQELLDTVWPNVVVTDDSLVQCIRELRERLGDADHRLIVTVSRRGYRLDAPVRVTVQNPPSAGAMDRPSDDVLRPAASHGPGRGVLHVLRGRRALAVAAGLVCISLASAYLLFGRWPLSPVQASRTSLTEMIPPAAALLTFKDCDVCPEMTVLPAGKFMMGSPESEPGRHLNEGLPRRVVMTRPFAIGKFEITVDQFAAFVADTGWNVGSECHVLADSSRNPPLFEASRGASFRYPGFDVTRSHPAGCVSWHDAQAYAMWLKRRTGKPYRLPIESEWEYAARADTATAFSFGNDESRLCDYGRFSDLQTPSPWRGACRSSILVSGSLPVGTLKPNPWGIFDMHGNLWEWVEDCWTSETAQIPADGTAFTRPGKCEIGVVRGGSWLSGWYRLRSAFRYPWITTARFQQVGFRVALSLDK